MNKRHHRTSLSFGALLALLCACSPPMPEATTGTVAHASDEASAPPDTVDIPPTVRSNLGITFATVQARRVAQTLRVPGSFELQPRARHEYRMSLPGRVELLVDQYERVTPGQALFRFQSPTWPELLHEIIVGEQNIDTALAEIAVGEAKLTEAQLKLDVANKRVEALAQADFKRADLESQVAELAASIPRLGAELQLAQTRLGNARRTRAHALHRAATAADIPEDQLEAQVEVNGKLLPRYLTIDWIEVRAADAGVVELLCVTDGSFVEPPAPVLSTVNPEQVRFRALALQGDLPRLMAASEASIVPPQSPGTPIGETVAATMTFGLEAHPMERTLTLLATPEHLAPWIRPGVSAFLEVVVGASEGTDGMALAIPRSAVVKDGLTHVFFRRDPQNPNRALRVKADLGVSDGRWIVLKSGVMQGDEVVLAGAYELKLATERGGDPSKGGGHVHADGSTHDDH